jgi:hypothetical protein
MGVLREALVCDTGQGYAAYCTNLVCLFKSYLSLLFVTFFEFHRRIRHEALVRQIGLAFLARRETLFEGRL